MSNFFASIIFGLTILISPSSAIFAMQDQPEDGKIFWAQAKEYAACSENNRFFTCDGNPENCPNSGFGCGMLYSLEKIIRFAGSHKIVSGGLCACALAYQCMAYYGLDMYAFQELLMMTENN